MKLAEQFYQQLARFFYLELRSQRILIFAEASLDTPRLAAAGNLNEENYKAAGCHSLGLPNPGNISYQFPTGNSGRKFAMPQLDGVFVS